MALVKLYAAGNALEAHHLRGLLAQAEIESVVMGESLAIARGDLPMTQETLPAVWVREEDALRAMEIVREFVQPQDAAHSTRRDWRCGKCGEAVEGQFGLCWNCGGPRPEF